MLNACKVSSQNDWAAHKILKKKMETSKIYNKKIINLLRCITYNI